MSRSPRSLVLPAAVLATIAAVLLVWTPGFTSGGGCCTTGGGPAQGYGPQHGAHGGRRGGCMAPRADGSESEVSHASDQEVFHFLLDHRDAITRTVSPLENGVATVTETDDPGIRKVLREHVASMAARVENGWGIHLRDPLFAELFRNADRIALRVEDTERGVRVTETSDDPHAAELIRAHAEVVSGFLANGHAEVMRNHAVPGAEDDGA